MNASPVNYVRVNVNLRRFFHLYSNLFIKLFNSQHNKFQFLNTFVVIKIIFCFNFKKIVCLGFLLCWAIFVLLVTTLIGLFKREKDDYEQEYENISVLRGYKLLGEILKLPRIRMIAIALLTTRVNMNC